MDILSATASLKSALKSTKPSIALSSSLHSTKPSPEEDLASAFFVLVTGQIVGGDIFNADDLYCRYTLTYGNDWTILHGSESGLSQIARKGPITIQGHGGIGGGSGETGGLFGGVFGGGGFGFHSTNRSCMVNNGINVSNQEDESVTWNLPIDLTFKSTNAYGWPRLSVSVYSIDSLGRDVVMGYASILIPPSSGSFERVISIYRPMPSSAYQRTFSWFLGAWPEFFDTRFVNQGEGREVTRVEVMGNVRLRFNVATKGMHAFGYNNDINGSRANNSNQMSYHPSMQGQGHGKVQQSQREEGRNTTKRQTSN